MPDQNDKKSLTADTLLTKYSSYLPGINSEQTDKKAPTADELYDRIYGGGIAATKQVRVSQPQDYGITSFDEGLEAGYKGLKSGLQYAGGEALNWIGAEQAGESLQQSARETMESAPQSDSSIGFFLGSLAPSVAPTALAIAAAPFTGGSSIPAMASIGTLTASSAGGGMMEYENYKKEKGLPVDPLTKLGVGAAYGLAEGLMERLQLGKLVPKGLKAKLLKGDIGAAEKAGEDILERYARKYPDRSKELFRRVRQGMTTEGYQEAATEIAQVGTEILYQEDEDAQKTLEEAPINIGMAFLGGSIMGGALGPLSYASENKIQRDRRKQQGRVVIAENKQDGQGYEIVSRGEVEGKTGFQAISPTGEQTFIEEKDIGQVANLTLKQFENLLRDDMPITEFRRQQEQAGIEREISEREPVRVATYQEREVEIVGQDEAGDYYIQLDGRQKLVSAEELEDIQEIPPEAQVAAERQYQNEQETDQALQVDQQSQSQGGDGVLTDPVTGDFVYPGDENYTQVQRAIQDEQARRSNMMVGQGKNRQELTLRREPDGAFSVLSASRDVDGELTEIPVHEMTGQETNDLVNELTKELEGKGNYVVESFPVDASDPNSAMQVFVMPQQQGSGFALDQYEVQADGAQVRILNPEGKEVGRQSKNYLPKVKEYFQQTAGQYSQMPRATDNNPDVTEENLLDEIAANSENPVELSEAYLMSLEQQEIEDSGSIKTQFIAQDLAESRIPTSDLEGRDVDNPIYYAQYASRDGEIDIAMRSEYLSDQLGMEVTESDITEFIFSNPGGPKAALNQKPEIVTKLEERFKEVTGVDISKGLADSILESAPVIPVQEEVAAEQEITPEETEILNSLEQELTDVGVTDEELTQLTAIAEQATEQEITDTETAVENAESEEQALQALETFFDQQAQKPETQQSEPDTDAAGQEIAPENQNIEAENNPEPQETEDLAESAQTEGDLEPIRQLGPGANVYFETEKYRVNDFRDGVILNIHSRDPGKAMAVANINFDTAREAVKIAEQFHNAYPDGVPEALDIDRYVDQLKNDITQETEPTRTEQLSEKEQKAKDELSSLFDEFNDQIGGQLSSGFDPKLIELSVKIIAKGGELGYIKFQQFADFVINQKGSDFFRRIFQSFKAAYSASATMQGNPNNEDLNALAKSTADDFISEKVQDNTPETTVESEDSIENFQKTDEVSSDTANTERALEPEWIPDIGIKRYQFEPNTDAGQNRGARYISIKMSPEVLNAIDNEKSGGELLETYRSGVTSNPRISDDNSYVISLTDGDWELFTIMDDADSYFQERIDKKWAKEVERFSNENIGAEIDNQPVDTTEESTEVETINEEVSNETETAQMEGEAESVPEPAETAESGTEVSEEIPKSSTQFNIEGDIARQAQEFAESIPESELYTAEVDHGRETEPHVTLFYGLTDNNPQAVQELLAEAGEVEITLGKTSLFQNDDYDVLKVDVEGDKLRELHEQVKENLPNETTFPDYNPHMTIAYLKPGEGEKYSGDTRFEGESVTLSEVIHSSPDREQTPVSLISGTESSEPDPPDGWRDGLIKARKYARALGLSFDGLSLQEIVQKIDQHLGQTESEPAQDESGINADESGFVDEVKANIRRENILNKAQLNKLADDHGIGGEDKRIKELAELAIVNQARQVVEINPDVRDAYAELVDLYTHQPNLTARTSTSIELQQYSTPAPLAYMMGRYVNLHDGVAGYEPSAGNGLLTIAAGNQTGNIIANEIDSDRLDMLQDQGFSTILNRDGSEEMPDLFHTQQAVITNPPFGKTLARYQYDIDGRKGMMTKLEHVMAARGLESMRDDGKAAILIGGNDSFNDSGIRTGQDAVFFNWLYHNYNVEGIINLSGSFFKKQGASFPTRIILVNKRKVLPSGFAPVHEGEIDVVDSFDSFYERIANQLSEANDAPIEQTKLDSERETGSPVPVRGSESEADPNLSRSGTLPETRSGKSGRKRRSARQSDSGPDAGDGTPDRGRGQIGLFGESTSEQRSVQGADQRTQSEDRERQENRKESDQQPEAPRDLPAEKSTLDHRVTAQDVLANEGGNIVYAPLSDSGQITTEMPSSMAMSMRNTLESLANEVGNVDGFVMEQLGYDTTDQLYNALAAEQIDAVALAIKQVEKSKSLIVGDQTGIGKGRVAAAMLRYAKNQGLTPVFFTEKDNLFSDMHRDLEDIGSTFKPFIVNANTSVKDQAGKVVYKTEKGQLYNSVLNNPDKVSNYDYVAITYSQIQNTNSTRKRNFVEALAPNALIVMDESHNASGQSNTGEFMMDVLKEAQGAIYLSATFAKRPDNIPVYAMKTDISDVAMDFEEMVEAIESGGVALQEIISSDLVKAGQMVRRQRSFKGVKREFEVVGQDDKGNLDKIGTRQRQMYDHVSEVMRNTIEFQNLWVDEVLREMDKDVKDEARSVSGQKGVKKAGVDNPPFVSRIHNIVDQLLFSIKVDAVADEAVRIIENGQKPVIAVKSTMEAILDDTFATGEDIQGLNFGIVMERALKSVMKYQVKDGITGSSKPGQLKRSDLSQRGQQAYDRIVKKANEITEELHPSPIDYLVMRIEQAGYTIGEVTGRSRKIDLNRDGSGVVRNRSKKERDKTDLYRKFNEGELDALIINSAGATGASAHASEKFSDQRQRVMVIHQPELNINTEVQKWGRIFRTGQVVLPEYKYITSSIPAETRLMMVLKKKIKSLDANTTSSQKTSSDFLEMEDFINKYGDYVVTQYLKENEDFHTALQNPIGKDTWDRVKDGAVDTVENIAMKTTGRVALLDSKTQEDFYTTISEQYKSYIEMLNEYGENDLIMDSVDLQAETISKNILVKGENTESVFGGDSFLEEVKARVLKKPMKKAEIDKIISDTLAGKQPRQYSEELGQRAEDYIEQWLTDRKDEINARDAEPDAKAESIKRAEDKADHWKRNTVGRLFTRFRPGELYIIPADSKAMSGMTKNAVFAGFDINENSKNPFAPSSIKLRFITNDSQRTVTIPGSNMAFINSAISDSGQMSTHAKETILARWDESLNTNNFENRLIATGNILQAMGMLDGKGQLIQYTTKDGDVKNGILLPKNMKEEDLNKLQNVRVKAIQALDSVHDVSVMNEVKMSGGVSFERGWDDRIYLVVPSSKSRGGKFFLDEDLRGLLGDFTKRGNKMRAEVPVTDVRETLKILTDKFSVFAEISRSDSDVVVRENLVEEAVEVGEDVTDTPTVATTPTEKRQEIKREIKRVTSQWANDDFVHVVDTVFDLPPALTQRFVRRGQEKQIAGVYSGDHIYVIADNADTVDDALQTLKHEAFGHMGLRSLVANMSYNRQDFEGRLRGILTEVHDSFKDDSQYRKIANSYDLDLRSVDDRMVAAEEFLARTAEGDLSPTLWNRIVKFVNDLMKALGFRQGRWSRADVLKLLRDSRAHVEGDAYAMMMGDGDHLRTAFFSLNEDITNSDAFRQWFGESKVVDVLGGPQVVFHGTPDSRGLREGFKSNVERLLDKDDPDRAFFFSKSRRMADSYADDRRAFDYQNAVPETLPVYLSLQNPLIIDANGDSWNKFEYVDGDRTVVGTRGVVELAKEKGHDGIIVNNVRDNYQGNKGAEASSIYAAFEPTQIKSATENQGTFDSSNPDIRFRFGKVKLDDYNFQYQRRFDNLVRKFQDAGIAGKRATEGVREAGGKVTDQGDFYQDETLSRGRVSTQLRRFEQGLKQELVDIMQQGNKDKGITHKDYHDYLYARHAPEVNAHFMEQNPDGGNAQSGMSDAEAEQIMQKVESEGWSQEMDQMAGKVDEIIDQNLKSQLAYGLISRRRYGQLKKQWEHYVPLRGFEDFMDVDPTLYVLPEKRQGRRSKAGDILAYTMAMHESTIIRGEQNLVKQKALRFTQDNYDRTDLVEIKNVYWLDTGKTDPETGKQVYLAHFDKPTAEDLLTGRIVREVNPEQALTQWEEKDPFVNTQVRVMHEGRPVVLEFRDPHIAEWLNRTDLDGISDMLTPLNKYMSFLRNAYITYSPEFSLRNLFRDGTTGAIHIATDFDVRTAMAITNPKRLAKAGKAMFDAMRTGEYNGPMGQATERYLTHGAISGYHQLSPLKRVSKALQEDIENHGSAWYKTKNGLKNLGEYMDNYTSAIENAIRISTYDYLVANGVTNPDTGKAFTEKQAANYAKNLTVNFNRKGSWGPNIGSFYLFFNATIQGIARQFEPFMHGSSTRRKIRAAAVPLLMGGTAYLMTDMLRLAMGVDDDDEYNADKINDFTMGHRILIPNFFSEDEKDLISIPLPYGLNAYWAAGVFANKVTAGSMEAGDAALKMLGTAYQAYNPIGGELSDEGPLYSGFKTAIPQPLIPPFEMITNENFTGRPIKPEQFPYGPQKPDSENFFYYTGEWAKKTARALNKITGGDEFESGLIDVSPNEIEFIVSTYLGGAGNFAMSMMQTADQVVNHALGEQEMSAEDMRRAPMARVFFSKVPNSAARSSYFENYKELEQMGWRHDQLLQNRGVAEAEAYWKENEELMNLIPLMKATRSRVNKSYKILNRLDQAGAPESDSERVLQDIRQLYNDFNREVNRAKGRGASQNTTPLTSILEPRLTSILED